MKVRRAVVSGMPEPCATAALPTTCATAKPAVSGKTAVDYGLRVAFERPRVRVRLRCVSCTKRGHLAKRQRALPVEKHLHRLGADVRAAIGKQHLSGLCSWNMTWNVGSQLALLSGSALSSFKRASTAWGLTHGPPPCSPPSVRAATNAGTCAIGAAATAADRRAAPESNSAPWRVIRCGRPSARYRCTSRQPLHKRTRAHLYRILRLFGDSKDS